MSLSSLAVIGVSVEELANLGSFLQAFEQNLPAGCTIVIFCTNAPAQDLQNSFTKQIYRASSLPVEPALPNTPLREGTVFVIPAGEKLIVNSQSLMLYNTAAVEQNSDAVFWQSLSQSGFGGIAAIIIDSNPGYLPYLSAINLAGGITLLCQSDNLGGIVQPNVAATFNYVLPASDAALTAADFLRLFAPNAGSANTTATTTPLVKSTDIPQKPAATTPLFTTLDNLHLQPELHDLLHATQTALLVFDQNLCLIQLNALAKQYVVNAGETKNLDQLRFSLPLPTIAEDTKEVLKTGNQKEYCLPNSHGVLTDVLVFARTYPPGICIALTPVSQSQLLSHRLTLLANELEKQGIEQIKTILQLRREIEINEQQRELLESILVNMGEAVLATDEDGHIILLNSMARQITGIQKPGIPLKYWAEQFELCYPMSNNAVLPHQNPFTRSLQGIPIAPEEWFVTNKQTGKTCYWQIIASPYKTKKNAASSGSVIVISDITTRKQGEIELKNSELTKKALLDAIPDLLFRVNEEGEYLDYIAAKSDNHIPAAAFIGNKLTDFLPPEIAGEIMSTLKKSLETLQIQTFPFEHVDNVIKFYEARFSPINHTEALGMVRDVTDMIVGKDAIHRGARHYQKLIRVSAFPIIVCNRKGEIISANLPAAALLGTANEQDLTGCHIEDFVSKKQRMAIKEAIKDGFVETLSFAPLKLTLLTQNGNEKEVEVSGTIITYENQLAAQIVLNDLGPQMHWEKQYNTLFSQVSDSMVKTDVQKLVFTDANNACLKLFGCQQKKEIVGKKWTHFSPAHQPDDGGLSSKKIAEILKNAVNNASFFWTFQTPSGSVFSAKVTLYASGLGSGKKEFTALIQPQPNGE